MQRVIIESMEERMKFDKDGYSEKAAAFEGEGHLVGICKECRSLNIGEQHCGDEGWTVCRDCQTVEGGYLYVTPEEAEEIA